MSRNRLIAIRSLPLVALVLLAPHVARAEPEAPQGPSFEHGRGFAVDARLSLSPQGVLGTAPVSLGYRGRSFAVLIGPLFGRTQADTACTNPLRACDGPSRTWYGAQLRADVTVVRAASGRLDGYVPLAVSVSGETAREPSSAAVGVSASRASSGEATWGAAAGLGARYWVTSNLALLGEVSLAYGDEPGGLVTTGGGGFDVLRNQHVVLGGAGGASFVF